MITCFGYAIPTALQFSAIDVQLIVIFTLQCQKLEVTVCRDGKEYRQRYSRGKPLTTLSSTTLPDESSSRQGSCIRFWPDKESMHLFFRKSFSDLSIVMLCHVVLPEYSVFLL